MDRKYIEPAFFLGLLLGTITLVAFMLLPYLNIIVLAAILAFLFSDVFAKLVRVFKNRTVAAGLTTILVFITVLVPLSLAGYRIAQESAGLYGYLREQASSDQFIQGLNNLQDKLNMYLPGVSLEAQDITTKLQEALRWVIGHIGSVFAGISRLFLGFMFLLLFFFYLVRDGERLKRRLMDLSPLSDKQENGIIERIGRAITATVRGQITLAIFQGTMAGIGYWIFGVPNPALWGAVLMLASFVPTIGTTLVQSVAVLFLFANGHTGEAFGLAIWALTAVGLLDNFLGPKLMSRGTRMHPLVMLLAVLGGVTTFGPMGILLGPIIVSLLYALLDIYMTFVRHEPLKPLKKTK